MKSFWIIKCSECTSPMYVTTRMLTNGLVIHGKDVKSIQNPTIEPKDGDEIECLKCGSYSYFNERISDKKWLYFNNLYMDKEVVFL